ncbi:ATP-dependent DNA helicase [Anaerosphaera multitolerans]|uniref:ATP-dependent DNA helicase n=1 Tax=Anaerosphaera multitolerans TaxID=2487351 RepID=A0A437S6H4_9FIRM|nr:ATP-dependent DNA helicase [Anaerosphaera multitolerans]RVU54606.1 ATP-dependent DNA helicase [Anaerosphaera multitolerans]
MKEIKLSVHSLIDFVMRSGDIDNTFTGVSRMREGQKIHKKLQREYGRDYESEVTLKNITKYKEITFLVEGRADGIFHRGEEVLIDEIKSTTRSLDDLKYNSNPLHWAQAKCYGYFYCVEKEISEIEIQITYFQVETKEIKQIVEKFNVDELEKFYLNLLDIYLDFSIMILNFKKLRDMDIENLKFPFPDYRKGQREMAVAVYRTIEEGKVLFAEAPTGIGKTISTLFPAIKSISSGFTDKIFYLTARSTTKEAANNAVENLSKENFHFKTLTLTAKEKICINESVKCNPNDCPYAKGHFDRVNDAIIDIYENEVDLTMEKIVEYSQKYIVCPMEFQLDMAIYSDLVICDYNYAFDPNVYLRRFFEDSVEKYTFLIDESHNLVDRSREMYSCELSLNKIERTMEVLEENYFKINDRLKVVSEEIKKHIDGIRGNHLVLNNLDEEFLNEILISIRLMERFLVSKKDNEFYEDVLDLYFDFSKFIKISDYYGENYSVLILKEDEDVFFKLFCIDTAPIFKYILKRAEASIFFSATLSPMEFYGDVLGAEDYYKLRLTSPFNPDNLKVGVVPISTRYQHREQNYGKITEVLENYTNRKGNFMLFFPSYKFMETVYNKFHKNTKNVVCQKSDLREVERREFLDKFKEGESLIAFVVLGGVFSEGIDLIGERLNGVAIVSVGLPGISIERNLIKDYYNKKSSRGFEYSYIYPGINKVSQAAGRVIRSSEDRGSVLLIDDRFLYQPYRNLLPKSWKKIKRIKYN